MSARGDFWSRRRAAVEAEQRAEQEAREAVLRAEEEAKLEEKTDEDFLAELDLPEPELMDTTEQVKTLLNSAVPQRLKKRAMRRLWRLNPVLANLDGLNDYDDDYTDAATVVENLKTGYQVGKGMLKALQWESPKPVIRVEDDAEDDLPEAAADDVAVAFAEDQPAPEPQEQPAVAQANLDDDPSDPLPAPVRRMRFRFEPAT